MSKFLVVLAVFAMVAVALALPAPQQEPGRPEQTGDNKGTDLKTANSFYGGYYGGGFGYPGFYGGYGYGGYGFGHPGFYGHGFGYGYGYPYYG